ncbi:2-amino-4-hydroxy-6-hydroxymethyldihydropteridine diphosphokinase [Planctomycetales bacterium]|nr:2-amino-4-hydroxy-6-hydroxymethyldihydropteridine diphosphokinase [Planctomycetales bacterium]GHT08766.1 2-amino-4-hydroxy-6-hydroxymethyldihydropteridine diphosphokinase [Planctomycetales bacterium]
MNNEFATDICLALGANLGDRAKNLGDAVKLLGEKICVEKISRRYETAPVGVAGQPLYLNGALRGKTALSATELLAFCLDVEKRLGRQRPAPRWSARRIDIDLIFYGDEIIDLPELQVPHPRYAERDFVLRPLNEIAPEWVCPRRRRTVAELQLTR